MKLSRLLSIRKSQRGIALMELMVGIAVIGAIGGVMVTTIIQTDAIGTSSRNHIVSVNYVHNAGYWIQVDAKMAQTVHLDDGDSGLPLTLSWVEWDNTKHQVTYALKDDELLRIHSVNSSTPNAISIAQSVNTEPDFTNCEFTDGMLNFTLTTSEGYESRMNTETRVFSFKPRAELVVLETSGE